jgi:hypothetical protein
MCEFRFGLEATTENQLTNLWTTDSIGAVSNQSLRQTSDD